MAATWASFGTQASAPAHSTDVTAGCAGLFTDLHRSPTDSDDLTVRVALLWYNPSSRNLGVQALAHAQLRQLASYSDLQVEIVPIGNRADWSDASQQFASVAILDPVVADLRTLEAGLVGRGPLARALSSCDVAIANSEGDSFSDIYGLKRFAVIAGLYEIALRRQVPLLLSPQTIGPFAHPMVRRWAKSLMKRSVLVATRDLLSLERVRSLGVTALLATDMALHPLLEREVPESVSTIALNVSGLLWSNEHPQARGISARTRYRELMVAVATSLLERDCRLRMVPHVVEPVGHPESDLGASVELRQILLGRDNSSQDIEIFVPASFAAGQDAMRGVDGAVTGRMHAAVSAFGVGTPVVPLDYSSKALGLFGSLGYDFTLSLDASVDGEAVRALLEAAIQSPTQLGLAMSVARGRQQGWHRALGEWLSGGGGGSY